MAWTVWATTFAARGSEQTTASNVWLNGEITPAAALPSRAGLGRKIRVRARDTGLVAVVPVIDVGPHYVDDPYWQDGEEARPLAEALRRNLPGAATRLAKQREPFRSRGLPSQSAGLDLTPAAWRLLGLSGDKNYSGTATWEWADVNAPDPLRPRPPRGKPGRLAKAAAGGGSGGS